MQFQGLAMADGFNLGALPQQLSGMIYPGIQMRVGYGPGAGGSIGGNESTSQQQSQSQTANQSYNQSQSQSFIPDYSQTPILESIAQEAQNYAPQVYQWGIDAYNKSQGLIDKLYQQGQEWASPQHIAAQMGAAEAGVQQAGAQALESSKRDLMSFGVDPGAGRYRALDEASRVATAAAAAGAGNQQRNADIAQGLTMQNQAMSAGLQNTQTGYGAANALNSLLSTGMQLKYSPLGISSTASGASSGAGFTTSSGGSQSQGFSLGMGGGGGGGGAGGGVPKFGDLFTGPYPQYGADAPMAAEGGYIGDGGVEKPGYQTGGVVRVPKFADLFTGPYDQYGAGAPMADGGPVDYQMGGMIRGRRGKKAKFSTKRGKMPKPQQAKPPPQDDQQEEPAAPAPTPAPDLTYGVPQQQPQQMGGEDQDQDQALGYQQGGAVTDPIAEAIQRQAGMPQTQIDRLQKQQTQLTTPTQTFQGGGAVGDPIPVALKAGRPAGTGGEGANIRDPSTGAWTTAIQPGEFASMPPERVGAGLAGISENIGTGLPGSVIGGRGGGRAARHGRFTHRYAAGGVVGTTTLGYTPSTPTPAGVLPGPPTQAFQGGGPIEGSGFGRYGRLKSDQGFEPGISYFDPANYEQGGGVTTGGFVSHAMSPSNGRQVDDVPARLNQGEYVIPRDVVHFKGKEFFHKLIAQSRANRAKMGAPSDDRGYNLGGAI